MLEVLSMQTRCDSVYIAMTGNGSLSLNLNTYYQKRFIYAVMNVTPLE